MRTTAWSFNFSRNVRGVKVRNRYVGKRRVKVPILWSVHPERSVGQAVHVVDSVQRVPFSRDGLSERRFQVVGGRARFVLVLALGRRRGRFELNDIPVDSAFFAANRSFGKSGEGQQRRADDYDGEREQN